jgi:methylated-DNA-protein-cysteine methyltransferase related protein
VHPPRSRRRPAAGAFFARVYALVRAIPPGQVLTYGEVARLLGQPRGARAVGWALRALDAAAAARVPWHRVLGAGGRVSLPGSAGEVQARRLRAEGVSVRGGRPRGGGRR